MTVVVAAVTKRGVTMAADSESSSGWQKANLATPKLWTRGRFAFGCAGSLRTAQVLRHHVDWPEPHDDDLDDFESFLVRRAVPAIWRGVKGHGITEKHKGAKYLPMDMLIAWGPLLANIECDGCVSADPSGRMAIGSGYAEALGSMGDQGPWKRADLIEAARRASISAQGVGGPIMTVDTHTLEVRPAE